MILYLHGFLSSAQSAKGQWLQREFSQEGISFHCLSYPLKTPFLSLDALKTQMQALGCFAQNQPWIIMGSSMGGFYAQYLAQEYQKPLVMINPALQAVKILSQHRGLQQHPTTQETFDINTEYLKGLNTLQREPDASIKTLLLLDEGDEVIAFEPSLRAYENTAEVLCFKNGSHAFEHLEEAWPTILAFAQQNLKRWLCK